MDIKIEIYAWDVGSDEADELLTRLADVCAERRLGLADPSDDSNETVRCLIIMKPVDLVRAEDGEAETDDGVPVGLDAFLRENLEGATNIVIPGAGSIKP